jgi:FKBP-type peptidyl-prolyl cis-trans isomerase FkpA/FKBP-type peptidyl-prolyl cis-trans isomerase FklB
MTKALLLSVGLVLGSLVPAVASGAEPKTDEQKTLYALGVVISRNLASFNLSAADLEHVQAGLADGVLHKEPKVDLQAYGPRIQVLQAARVTSTAAGEKKAGQAFADRAATEKGATRTASGMVISTLKPGSGASPGATDTVKVHYQGTLIDGTVFDSSLKRGEPATLPLNRVIKCWTEGLQTMKVGGKSRLVCPAEIAYGDRGAAPLIKPGATLVFEIELIEIVR